MGQKINSIALRLGGRNLWWISNGPAVRQSNKIYEWFWINTIVTGVLKSYNIILSELVIKFNKTDAKRVIVSEQHKFINPRSIINEHVSASRVETNWKSININREASFEINESIISRIGQTHLEINGLIFKPELSGDQQLKTDAKRREADELTVQSNMMIRDTSYTNLLKTSRLQSANTELLLKEAYELIKKLISNCGPAEQEMTININLEHVKTPKNNSLMLSNWVELGLLGSGRDFNEKRILKMLTAKPTMRRHKGH